MSVFRSAEIRWFFPGTGDAAIEQWMQGGTLAEQQAVRVDEYLLLPGVLATSVKIREGRFEIKMQTTPSELQQYPGGVAGYRDGWVKWSRNITGAAELPRLARGEEGWAAVRKQRTLRLYSLEGAEPVETAAGGPVLSAGCQVEYSLIEVMLRDRQPPASWWSFSLEAFGRPGSEEDNLDRTVDHILIAGIAFSLPLEASMSYPAWLQRITNL
jgi:hypothetical protein